MRYAALLYQAGIANVFELESIDTRLATRKVKRLMQADFRSCEMYARGLKDAGVAVTTMHVNVAGDAAQAEWSGDLDTAPFCDKFQPVFSGRAS